MPGHARARGRSEETPLDEPTAAAPPNGAEEPTRGRTHVARLGPATRVSFAVVVLALVLLLILPLLVRQRSDVIRRTATDVSEPARDLAEAVERDLAVQAANARGYALTGDPRLLREYEAAGANAGRALQRMRPLAEALGPEAAGALARLRSTLQAWEADTRVFLARSRFAGGGAPGTAFNQTLFQETIQAAARLDEAIDRAVAPRRAEARRIDETALLITAVLVVLVLISVGVLVWLATQLRLLAEEARSRAQLEANLRGELERSVEARARLVRGFSHDVRNPLGAADGYAQMLHDGIYGELEPRQKESVARIRRAIAAAVLLTDDLVDVARLEAGQLKPAEEPVELNAVISETTEEYRAQAEAAGLELKLCLPERPLLVSSDGPRIRQILANLLSNAIKYTTRGGSVSVGLTEDLQTGRPGPWVGIQVTDTGLGIEPEARARIFDEFARLDPATTRGAGLGLAISRRLARALGGDITLESEPGSGSTFTLQLPRREALPAS